MLPENVEGVQRNILEKKGLPRAAEYVGPEAYKELCERDDIDLVYICTGWQNHVEIAVYAMQQGKHVAVEVPAATSVEECWRLVDVSEQTQRHCMMLENCCYDFFELTCLNMAKQGVFGEVIHGEGAYIHNLEPIITTTGVLSSTRATAETFMPHTASALCAKCLIFTAVTRWNISSPWGHHHITG